MESRFRLEGCEEDLYETEDLHSIDKGVLSINQMRKIRRYTSKSEHKKEKRKEERRRRRERFKERRENGEKPKEQIRQEQIERLLVSRDTGIQVCIDLQYSENMSSKELQRLSSQLKRVYGSNKSSKLPFSLTFAGLKRDGQIYEICEEKISGFAQFIVEMKEDSVAEIFDKNDVVYLTPDADEYLENLEKDKVYVIGGLVDDTVQKKVSLNYSEEIGITARKLPIEVYLKKRKSGTFKQILTINQVFDILIRFQETNDWTESLLAGIPQRVGFVSKHSCTDELEN